MIAQIVARDRLPCGERMIGRKSADADIVFTSGQPFAGLAVCANVQTDHDVGMVPHEFGHRRTDHRLGDARHRDDTQVLGLSGADFRGDLGDLVEIIEYATGFPIERQRLGRGDLVPPGSIEQSKPQLALQRGDQAAERPPSPGY